METYMSVAEAAKIWDITVRRVQTLCNEGRINGVQRLGRSWAIPKGAQKPSDDRIKSGKYVGVKRIGKRDE